MVLGAVFLLEQAMKLCSITVTSSTKESIIADCMRSVAFCDMNLIVHMVPVDQGYQDDRTLEIARSIAGSRYRQIDVPMYPGNTIEVFRNAGLDEATRLGADWAVQCDTDDRIVLNGVDIKKTLERVDANIMGMTVYAMDGETDRALIFRLPTIGKYENGIHEDFSIPITHAIERVRYQSIPKTPEQLKARSRLDLEGLKAQWDKEPNNPRWPYYAGIAAENLELWESAVSYHQSAADICDDPGFYGWLYFRMALILNDRMESPASAMDKCMSGMKRCAMIPELPLMAGMCCYAMGDYANSEMWAKMALAHTWTKRLPTNQRMGPKSIGAYFEGPYLMLAHVYHATKQTWLAQWADREAMRAAKLRKTYCERGTI